MSEIKKSLITSVLVIIGVAAVIAVLVYQGLLHKKTLTMPEPVGKTAPVVKTAPDTLVIPVRSKPALVRGRDDRGSKHPRLQYAEWLDRGLKNKNRNVSVRAVGQDHGILQLTWPVDKVDTEHMEQLKKAPGFFEKLRFLAFSKLVMKVGDKKVWQKDI
jgi:hypothetical protein